MPKETPKSEWEEITIIEEEIASPGSFYVVPEKRDNSPKLTLVLDLDETLIHFSDLSPSKACPGSKEEYFGGYYMVRPYALSFLEEMNEFYEIIIFTAGTQGYADWILDQIDDTNKNISHRLYRHHTMPEGDTYIKDLDLLNRDLKHTLIVDNLKENFTYHQENGIEIHSWYDDFGDRCLFHLGTILKILAEESHTTEFDIRESIKKFRP